MVTILVLLEYAYNVNKLLKLINNSVALGKILSLLYYVIVLWYRQLAVSLQDNQTTIEVNHTHMPHPFIEYPIRMSLNKH